MKEIYNTLTTKKSIRAFINDCGEIHVVYYKVNCEADLYNVKNIKEIVCLFGNVITKMNKFFFNSLLSVLSPAQLIKCNGEVTIYFDDENRAEKILGELKENISNAIKRIDNIERNINFTIAVKELSCFINAKTRVTKKLIATLIQEQNLKYAENMGFWFDNKDEERYARSIVQEIKSLNKDEEYASDTYLASLYDDLKKQLQYIS